MKPKNKNLLGQIMMGILLSCLLSWYLIENTSITEDTRFGSGYSIPTTDPDETNRLIHPAGFSIVIPPEWKTESEESSLSVSSGKRKERTSISVRNWPLEIDGDPDINYDSLQQLSRIDSLRHVSIVNTKVTKEGIAAFRKENPECRVIHFPRTPISN